MKTCPSCHKTYQDESLVFCLDDGARLVRDPSAHDTNATWNLPPPGPTVASPRPASPTAQSTLTSLPEQYRGVARPDSSGAGESRSSNLPWVFAIVVVLAVSGVLMAWLMTRGGGSDISNSNANAGNSNMANVTAPGNSNRTITNPLGNSNMANVAAPGSPTPERKPSATPERPPATPVPTPREPPPKPMFSVLNNMTLTGSRITYYQRTSFAGCQADCAANSNCKAATWIRPGAYNPSDPGMCYLMSAVTGRVAHVCCITALRN
jgi:hypothetical protein